jgi:Holliday junction resolvasome RuvABC DNA-binding subunit
MKLADKITALRKQVETATQRRSDALAAHKVAQKQLGDIDTAIKDLGYDPEMSDDALAALEAKLETDLDAASLLVQQEIAALDDVLAKAKAAGVL